VTILYEKWRQIARDHASELALLDSANGTRWTFAQLAGAEERLPPPSAPVSFPQGHTPQFILSLLSAWRAGRITCPLEPGQSIDSIVTPPSNCAHLKLTSATTGAARFVAFTGEQLLADAAQIHSTMGLRPEWPNLGLISLAHSYGFSNLVLPLLFFGVPLVLVPAPLPQIVQQTAATFPHLTIAAVPALWRAWHESDVIPPNTRLAISAGAALPLELEHAIHRNSGLKIHNFYGATECGGIAFDTTSHPRADAALIGRPMDGVTLSTSPEGTLIVSSAAVGQTYWPEAAPQLTPGRFITSDLVELRGSSVFFLGRSSDLINVAGRKISPEIIERALSQHPAVRECIVFGVPDPDPQRVETIVACLSLRSPATEADLRHFLTHHLPSWQLPRHWWFTDTLQPNQRGKLSRAHWRATFLNRQKSER
jgi:long-chain acyl-CoA synthetase